MPEAITIRFEPLPVHYFKLPYDTVTLKPGDNLRFAFEDTTYTLDWDENAETPTLVLNMEKRKARDYPRDVPVEYPE